MNVLYEKERKYLIDNVIKNDVWEKEHIVYQWYIHRDENQSIKDKVIFDILKNRIIYARVHKMNMNCGECEKKVEYFSINDFFTNDKLGTPFVLKRRSIKKNIFLDHFICSNKICEYLLEIESKQDTNDNCNEYIIKSEVTADMRFYNQNMCIPFEKGDAEKFNFLLSIFL